MASIQIHITHTTQTGTRTEAREFKNMWNTTAKETAAAFLRAEANRLSRKRKKKAR